MTASDCEQASPTEEYSKFADQVDLQLSLLQAGTPPNAQAVKHLLNGAASDALRQFVSSETRATDGIFFSGKALAKYVASLISDQIRRGATIADPACGAGDLLLACAERISIDRLDSAGTWDERFIGLDVHPEFVSAARSRLALLFSHRVRTAKKAKTVETISATAFHRMVSGNFFENIETIADADCVVMNPPFAMVAAPKNCTWASGSIQLAGQFLTTVLENAKAGQEIVAVLPDVLRSGTRYARWRDLVADGSVIKKVHVYGRFDLKTDVDVFVLHLTKELPTASRKNSNRKKWNAPLSVPLETQTLKDLCKVSVGAYVPFRAKQEAKEVRYLSVKTATPDGEISASEKCNFDGTLHATPFVVIRRTSNPSDSRRVIPTLVTTPAYIAVENHLIVLTPHDGTLKSCRKIMSKLGEDYVDNWMNQVIRCRHLTTAAVKNIPLVNPND